MRPQGAFTLKEIGYRFKRALLALGAPVIILGGILMGVFTATESAAVAVVYCPGVGDVCLPKNFPQRPFSAF